MEVTIRLETSESKAMNSSVERPSTPTRTVNGHKSTRPESFSSQPSIYVSNISEHSIDDLIELFSEFGRVLDAYFITGSRSSPPHSGDSSSSVPSATLSAIIKYETWTEAERAHIRFSGEKVPESLSVRYARPRSDLLDVSISARRLFIGQLPANITEQEIKEYFSQFGEIADVSLLDTRSSTQHSCAFVEYTTWEACDQAIAAGHGKIVFSDKKICRPLVVKYAKSKERPVCALNMHAYPQAGTLQELMTSEQLSHPSSPPTTGYVVCSDPMAYTVPAYWPISVAHDGFQPSRMVHCAPCYPPEYMMPTASMPMPIPHSAHANQFPYHTVVEDVDSRKIFVGQLPRTVMEEDLVSLFALYGPIEKVTILRSGARCGFVTFYSRYHALMAINEMHGAMPYEDGRRLVVRLASRRGVPDVPEEHGEAYHSGSEE